MTSSKLEPSTRAATTVVVDDIEEALDELVEAVITSSEIETSDLTAVCYPLA